MAGSSAVRFPSVQPATGLPSFQRPPHHHRPRDGVEDSTPRMLSLDKLQPSVGQTPKVADFGAKSANHRPSAFAKQSAYRTILHHQMSRRKSHKASARETVPPSLILPPAAE